MQQIMLPLRYSQVIYFIVMKRVWKMNYQYDQGLKTSAVLTIKAIIVTIEISFGKYLCSTSNVPRFTTMGCAIADATLNWDYHWATEDTNIFGSKQSTDGIGKSNLKAKSNDDPDTLHQCLIKNTRNVEYRAEYWRWYLSPQVPTNEIVFWKGHHVIESDLKEEEHNDAKIFHHNSQDDKVSHKPCNPIGSNNVQTIVSVPYNCFGNIVDKTTHEINSFFVKIEFLIEEIAGDDSPVMIFGDEWLKILPVDQEVDDRLVSFEVAELFIDVPQTQHVLNACCEYFSRHNDLNRMSILGCEFYLPKQEKQWIRPNYITVQYNIKNRIPCTCCNQFCIFFIDCGITRGDYYESSHGMFLILTVFVVLILIVCVIFVQ